MKVLVVGGGVSSEREISLRSAKSIMTAGRQAGYDMTFYDWDGSESWLMNHAIEFECILPIMHGTGAEDGGIQEILERTRVPYLGSGPVASRTCFDKQKTLEVYSSNGIKVPKGGIVDYEKYKKSLIRLEPHVLKPNKDGSSIGVIIVRDPKRVSSEEIERSFKENEELLLEELVDGIEITVPVLDGKEMPVIQIVPPENEEFDYENKYNGDSQEIINPESIPKSLQEEAQTIALKVHTLLGCRHLSRTDMIIRNGQIYVLETNTMPGMTDQSLFPKAANSIGLAYPELVDYFIKLVVK